MIRPVTAAACADRPGSPPRAAPVNAPDSAAPLPRFPGRPPLFLLGPNIQWTDLAPGAPPDGRRRR